jgi:hypothetical protein
MFSIVSRRDSGETSSATEDLPAGMRLERPLDLVRFPAIQLHPQMPTAALSTDLGTGHLPLHPLCSSSTRQSETNKAESRAHPISALDTQCSRVLN